MPECPCRLLLPRQHRAALSAPINRSNGFMARNFPLINLMLRGEVHQRDELPLGDAGWPGKLLESATYQRSASIAPEVLRDAV